MRAKRAQLMKPSLTSINTGLSLLLGCLAIAPANAAASLPEWPLTPTASAAAVATCDATDEKIWVWLPQHGDAPAQAMLQRWQQHPLAALSGCLQYRTYSDAEQLQCTVNGERQHQRCNLPLLPRELLQRHIVFTDAEIGSASAQQIVLPLNANLTVFAHEIAHWLGFADEYQMSPSLAKNYCQGRYEHPSLNVVLTRSKQLSAQELEQLWQRLPWREAIADWRLLGQQQADGKWLLGSASSTEVGLFTSQTCAGVAGVYSWKPVAKLTAMEYHDVNVWPTVYLETARALQRGSRLRNHDDGAE